MLFFLYFFAVASAIFSLDEFKSLTMSVMPLEDQPLFKKQVPLFSDNTVVALFSKDSDREMIESLQIPDRLEEQSGDHKMPFFIISSTETPEIANFLGHSESTDALLLWIPHHSDGAVVRTHKLSTKSHLIDFLKNLFSTRVATNNDRASPLRITMKTPNGVTRTLIDALETQHSRWFSIPLYSTVSAFDQQGEKVAEWKVMHEGVLTAREDDPSKQCYIDSCNPLIWNGLSEVSQNRVERLNTRAITQRNNRRHNYPKDARFFHPVGFEKTKIPKDLLEELRLYYLNNQKHHAVEKWHSSSTFVNYWDTPTLMIYLPESGQLKPIIYNSLQPILEKWSGVDLKPTAAYGIRVYGNNNFLNSHVDRLSTHVVSAILNLDQDVEEPWELEIYDHDGNAHEVVMEAGDMVFYESATCTHGRPKNFKGRFFANLFIHLKPSDPKEWGILRDTV